MRTLCLSICFAGLLALAGCGQQQQTSEPAPSGPAAAPSGYLGALARGQQVAVKGIDTASLNQDVQLFNAQEGRNPKDLNELVTQHYIGQLPQPPAGMKLSYDATTGKVSVIPQ